MAPRRRVALVGAVLAVAVGGVLLLLVRGGDQAVDAAPPLTAGDLDAIVALPAPPPRAPAKKGAPPAAPAPELLAGVEGDMRLLAELRRRIRAHGGTMVEGWRRLPAAQRDLYAMLRIEEVARTEGFVLGMAAVERGLGDVEPEEAAMAYDLLGQTEAGSQLRRLEGIIQRDGAAWRAALRPSAPGAPTRAPDQRELDQVGGLFADQVPAARAARARWLGEHKDELLAR